MVNFLDKVLNKINLIINYIISCWDEFQDNMIEKIINLIYDDIPQITDRIVDNCLESFYSTAHYLFSIGYSLVKLISLISICVYLQKKFNLFFDKKDKR